MERDILEPAYLEIFRGRVRAEQERQPGEQGRQPGEQGRQPGQPGQMGQPGALGSGLGGTPGDMGEAQPQAGGTNERALCEALAPDLGSNSVGLWRKCGIQCAARDV